MSAIALATMFGSILLLVILVLENRETTSRGKFLAFSLVLASLGLGSIFVLYKDVLFFWATVVCFVGAVLTVVIRANLDENLPDDN